MKLKPDMIPVVDPEKMLPEVQAMISRQAWKFADVYRGWGIDFHEFHSEAYWGFLHSCYSFDPNRKAKFSTWCYFKVWCRLKEFLSERKKDPLEFIDPVSDYEMDRRLWESIFGEVEYLSALFSDAMEDIVRERELTQDARHLISLILETPQELLSGIRPTPRQLKARIKRKLAKEGRTPKGIAQDFADVDRCFRWLWI